jgi:hypothetical protein
MATLMPDAAMSAATNFQMNSQIVLSYRYRVDPVQTNSPGRWTDQLGTRGTLVQDQLAMRAIELARAGNSTARKERREEDHLAVPSTKGPLSLIAAVDKMIRGILELYPQRPGHDSILLRFQGINPTTPQIQIA